MKKISLLITSIFLFACGSTSVVQSWKDPSTDLTKENFQKILVVALVKDESNRRITEDKIAALNPKLHASYPFINKAKIDVTDESKMDFIKNNGFDAVITMRLVSKEKQTNYVPGSYSGGGYTTNYYGGRFGGWYSTYSPGFYTPGYYTEDTKYLVETNVFSLKSDKLIWSGVTSSYNISSIAKSTDDIIKAVTKQMKKDGFLKD